MSNTEHEYLLVAEVAALARTSVDTVRAWMRSGRLASVKPGRLRLVRRVDFEAFMAGDRLVERKQQAFARDRDGGSHGPTRK
jgi:excisionase family DNA binding protein